MAECNVCRFLKESMISGCRTKACPDLTGLKKSRDRRQEEDKYKFTMADFLQHDRRK